MHRYDADLSPRSSVDLDGSIYVTSGGMGYVAHDGVLSPLQSLSSYVATMPPESVPLLGFESGEDPLGHVARDAKGAVRLFRESPWKPMSFRGGIVTPEYERGLAWVEAPPGGTGEKSAFAVKPGRRLRYSPAGSRSSR
jgi:hypothetical protein